MRGIRLVEGIVELEESLDWQNLLHGCNQLWRFIFCDRVVCWNMKKKSLVVGLTVAPCIALPVIDKDDGDRASRVSVLLLIAFVFDELGNSFEVFSLSSHSDDRSLLVLDVQMLASDRIQRLQCVLVGVHDLPSRDLVRAGLVHPHKSIVIRHVAHDLPVHLPVLVRERPPLGLLVPLPELHRSRTDEERNDGLESMVEVEGSTISLELFANVVGDLMGDEMRVMAQLLLPPQDALNNELHVVGPLSHQLALVNVPHEMKLRIPRILQHAPVAPSSRDGAIHGDTVEGGDAILGLDLGGEEPHLMLRGRHRRVRMLDVRPGRCSYRLLLRDYSGSCLLAVLLERSCGGTLGARLTDQRPLLVADGGALRQIDRLALRLHDLIIILRVILWSHRAQISCLLRRDQPQRLLPQQVRHLLPSRAERVTELHMHVLGRRLPLVHLARKLRVQPGHPAPGHQPLDHAETSDRSSAPRRLNKQRSLLRLNHPHALGQRALLNGHRPVHVLLPVAEVGGAMRERRNHVLCWG
mmetsp:Transcript_13025/g.45788  ORF Transcript_13025/g.45788 Transcript_13025/m.45788 type:complete len:525 (-) Transcript_13025:150-1724(-)